MSSDLSAEWPNEIHEFLHEWENAPQADRQKMKEVFCIRSPNLAELLNSVLVVLGGHQQIVGPVAKSPQQAGHRQSRVPWRDWRSFLPARIGEFELLDLVGSGGMGAVFKAWQPSLHRSVAVKVSVVPEGANGSTSELIRRNNREREVFSRLHHTSILPVFAGGEELLNVVDKSGQESSPVVTAQQRSLRLFWYAMTLVPGATLGAVLGHTQSSSGNASGLSDIVRQLLGSQPGSLSAPVDDSDVEQRRPARLTLSEGWITSVVVFMRRLCEAVEHIHENKLVHCDLKPNNIMLEPNEHPWIIDFGLARMLRDQPQTSINSTSDSCSETVIGDEESHSADSADHFSSVAGTPDYIAPEQCHEGPADKRSDVFALGEILFELLTLSTPYRGRIKEKKSAEYDWSLPVMSQRTVGVPADLEAICRKATQKAVKDRYQSAAEMAEDLRRFQMGQEVTVRKRSTVERVQHWRRLHPAIATASLMGMALLPLLVVAIAIHDFRVGQALQTAEKNYADARSLVETTGKVFREFALYEDARDDLDRQAESLERLTALVDTLRSVQQARPDIGEFALQLAGHLQDVANRSSDAEDQEKLYTEAIAILEAQLLIPDLEPSLREHMSVQLAEALNARSVDLNRIGKTDEALRMNQRAMDIVESLGAQTTDIWAANGLVRIRNRLFVNRACALEDLGELDEALAMIDVVVSDRKEKGMSDPGNADKALDYANSLQHRGRIQTGIWKTKRPPDSLIIEAARTDFAEAIRMLDQIVQSHPQNVKYSQTLKTTVNAMCSVHSELSELSEGIDLLKKYLPLAQSVADSTGMWEDKFTLAAMHGNLATFYESSNDPSMLENARIHLQKSADLLRALAELRPDHKALQENLQLLDSKLKSPGQSRIHAAYQTVLDGDYETGISAAAAIAADAAADADTIYNVACTYSIAIAHVLADTTLDDTKRKERADRFAAEAARLLRRAVESGFTDANQCRTDQDLDPLRERPDFKSVMQMLNPE